MNIKQVSERSGVSPQNIRFYEKEKLLCPARNPDNRYREYTEEDLRILKLIRMLRMLDMPLPEIRRILHNELSLTEAALAQRDRLKEQAEQLDSAIRFCGILAGSSQTTRELNVDEYLARMSQDPQPGSFFTHWVEDYRAVAWAEHNKRFSFFPDGPVTNPREFTDALLDYAAKQNLNLVIVHESMNPRFTIDGVEYKAVRRYAHCRNLPVATVQCTVVHPEDFEPDVSPSRRKIQQILHYAWPLLAFLAIDLLILLPRGIATELFTTWWGWGLILVFASMGIYNAAYNYYYIYNENGKTNRSHH